VILNDQSDVKLKRIRYTPKRWRFGGLTLKALVTVIGSLGLSLAAITLLFSDPYLREMHPVYVALQDGDYGAAETQLGRIIEWHPDRLALADRLLQESDGSLVAEAMVLAVRARHPRVKEILLKHLDDRRWNWSVTTNDVVAKELLLHLDGKQIEQYLARWLHVASDSVRRR
jgi:hypothetical protein